MHINEFLIERVVNLFKPDDQMKYADQVWALLQSSYEKAGGFHSADDIPDLLQKTNMWKLVVRDGKVTAANLYRDLHGRKSIAAGTDGTLQGKRDYTMIKDADIQFERAWGEVSGAPEKIMARAGLKPVPAKFAALLTGKEIIEFNSDGYHYTRLISGHPHEKIIYGTVRLTPEVMQQLQRAGINLNELPRNFRPAG